MSNSNPNQLPSPELSRGELVHYDSGHIARRFSEPSEALLVKTESYRTDSVGYVGIEGSSDIPTQDGGPLSMTIVRTANNRHYGYGGGLAIDMDLYEFEELPSDTEHLVVIGEKSTLPLVKGDDIIAEVISTAYIARSGSVEVKKSPNYGFKVLAEQFKSIVTDNRDNLPIRSEFLKRKHRLIVEMGARMTGLYPPSQED